VTFFAVKHVIGRDVNQFRVHFSTGFSYVPCSLDIHVPCMFLLGFALVNIGFGSRMNHSA
jgi:hypothetical protein